MDFGWFWLEVRKPDHGIPHVHACALGRSLVLSIETQVILESPVGFRGRDIGLIQKEVQMRRGQLLAKWRELNGKEV